jgi:hypothetical protein
MRRVPAPNARELQRYLGRIGDRWPLQLVMLGGTWIADLHPSPDAVDEPDGPDHVVVLVSEGFDGMPWLERVHQATSLWDTLEMGGPADVHCYTPSEYVRRRATTPAVQEVAEHGLLLFADTQAFTSASS